MDVGTAVPHARCEVTSHLERCPSTPHAWVSPIGERVPLPLKVVIRGAGCRPAQECWRVTATADVRNGELILTSVVVSADAGLNVGVLQSSFRWQTPLDIVGVLVPALMASGSDPFDVALPIDKFPDAARLGFSGRRRLSDEFLAEIAERYLHFGRGYAKTLGAQYDVSPRTVVSWVEKARRRGILTTVAQGSLGGEVVRKPPQPKA